MHFRIRHRLAAAALAVGLLGMSAAPAAAQTTLTFDNTGTSVAVGSIPANYGGATWSSDWILYNQLDGVFVPRSGDFRVYAQRGTGSLTFSTDVLFSGAYFMGRSSTTIGFRLKDKNGSTVHTIDGTNLTSTYSLLGAGYTGAIRTIEVIGSDDYYNMDDLNFTTLDAPVSAVPEPASLALILPGLGAVALLKRRKKAA